MQILRYSFVLLPAVLQGQLISAECVRSGLVPLRHTETIGILYNDNLDPAVVDAAIELWSSCRDDGTPLPTFLNGEVGERVVSLSYLNRSSGDGRCASRAGSRVVLFKSAIDQRGRPVACGSLRRNLAHELGHILGLGDAGDGTECRGHMMAPLSRANVHRRSPSLEECRFVAERWHALAAGSVDGPGKGRTPGAAPPG